MTLANRRSLRTSQDGVAYIEFALALPVVIMVTMYGLEIAWVTINQQKVNQIAAVTADNAARVRGTIDETDISEIMTGARMAGQRMKFTDHGRIVLSSIQQNPAGNGQWLRWQRCEGALATRSRYGREGKGQNATDLPGIGNPSNPMRAGAGNAIMLVEASYEYQPLISNQFYGRKTLRAETAFLVRDRTALNIGNSTNIASNRLKTCDDGNNGGGNDPGGVDPSNPGQGGGRGRTGG